MGNVESVTAEVLLAEVAERTGAHFTNDTIGCVDQEGRIYDADGRFLAMEQGAAAMLESVSQLLNGTSIVMSENVLDERRHLARASFATLEA